ncbi:putative SAC3/GANP family protein [Cryptosporidium felis]|nr:putative SAC3/GANP family protein [Cryptosporidium felis]
MNFGVQETFGGKSKAGREVLYRVGDEFRPPIESAYIEGHPLLRRKLFEDSGSVPSKIYFTIQDPGQLSSTGQDESAQEVLVGKLFGMCSREEMINKQQTSTANDFERLNGVTLDDDLDARIVNEYLAVKSFQRSDASRVFHRESVRSVAWCRMVVRRLLVYFIEADRRDLWYLYKRPSGQGYKYVDIYNFLRDRLRAVWQDLTVQHATRHRASIESFEVSFRFLLLSEECLCNAKDFNSVQNGSLMSTCLDKLMSGYMDVLYYKKKNRDAERGSDLLSVLVYDSPFQAEFWSYRVLTSMSIKVNDSNDNRIIDIIHSMPPELIRHPLIQLSLGIHCSFRLVNIVRYFRYFRKCYGILLELLSIKEGGPVRKQESGASPGHGGSDLQRFKHFGHSLILICVLIKKYSNIIRLRYLNILLSSSISKRQLVPLNSFIEIFGFYIESAESLKLFTERFEIKIFNKEDPSVTLFQGGALGTIRSIEQLADFRTRFVVSFRDCINLSSMESLSILNSLNWPSELLGQVLEKVPRTEILDPILAETSDPGFVEEAHGDRSSLNKESFSAPRPSLSSFTSLTSDNRDLINGGLGSQGISNNIIQGLREIDINKAKLIHRNKRKSTFSQESYFSNQDSDSHQDALSTNPNLKRRPTFENERNFYGNSDSPPPNRLPPQNFSEEPTPTSSLLEDTVTKNGSKQESGVSIWRQPAVANLQDLRVDQEAVPQGGSGPEEGKTPIAPDTEGICGALEVRDGGSSGAAKDSRKTDPVEATPDSKDFGSADGAPKGSIFEDGIIGLSSWRFRRAHFVCGEDVRGRTEESSQKRLERESGDTPSLGTDRDRVNFLLSRLGLPERESGIEMWLSSSVEGILGHIRTDIISKITKSLKFSFIFFYNQLGSSCGVSRSHLRQLSAFYTRLELVLSNLTSGDIYGRAGRSEGTEAFLFPWESAEVGLRKSGGDEKAIVDVYEVDFQSGDCELLGEDRMRKTSIPIHAEMLSVWKGNNKASLRSQLFSSRDFSLLKEKAMEDAQSSASEALSLESLVRDYLTNNGDVVIWTLPFLIRRTRRGEEQGEASLGLFCSDYMKSSLSCFAIEASTPEGGRRITEEFDSCCRLLGIERFSRDEVIHRVPILKSITIVFSFVLYIPDYGFGLADGDRHSGLRDEIGALEEYLEDLITKDCLGDCGALIIAEDIGSRPEDEDSRFGSLLISRYSGVSCNLQFRCIGLAPSEILQESARFRDIGISIYSPGLISAINPKLANSSFSNNLVVSSLHIRDLEVSSASFLSTLWVQSLNGSLETTKGAGLCELGAFRDSLIKGFIECFSLFTNGNIDWILLSGNCSYSGIKEIISWIYSLYIHSVSCLEKMHEFFPRMSSKSLHGNFCYSEDPGTFRELAVSILKELEVWINKISDSWKSGRQSVVIPQVIWDVIFDHLQPVEKLSCIAANSPLFELFSGAIFSTMYSKRPYGESESRVPRDLSLGDSEETLRQMDHELFKYRAVNYLNRCRLGSME